MLYPVPPNAPHVNVPNFPEGQRPKAADVSPWYGVYRLWERWKSIAHTIGNFQARLLLSLFYFLVLSPFGLGVRLFSDPLGLKKRNNPHWISRSRSETETWETARRQS